MRGFHIAQMNVGHALHPLDDMRMKDFIDNLDRVNALSAARHRGPGTDMKPEPYCVGWS